MTIPRRIYGDNLRMEYKIPGEQDGRRVMEDLKLAITVMFQEERHG